jgi:hypothetical protein
MKSTTRVRLWLIGTSSRHCFFLGDFFTMGSAGQKQVLFIRVWFNTPPQTMFARSAPAQTRYRLQKFGMKPKNLLTRGRVV